MSWRVYTMGELWELINKDNPKKKNLIKPKFPTRRWGDITTENASTDKLSIEKGITLLRSQGHKVRKRIAYDLNKKHRTCSKTFYKIEVKIEEEIDYDFIVPVVPSKTYKIKAKIKSVEKFLPKIFFE